MFFLFGCILLALAATIIGGYFLFRNVDTSDAFAWKAPIDQVDNRALVAETVLLPLTGVNSTDALSATLDKAQLENAYALLAYDPTLSDAARVGGLLQLGTRFAKANNTAKATACFQAAALLATLSPELSDQARMDSYQQASAGLHTVGANAPARLVTDQGYIVAEFSPTLQRDARARRLNQVADDYATLGVASLSAQARQKSIDVGGATTQDPVIPVRVPFNPTVGKLAAAPNVDAAVKTRIAAAQLLSDDLANLGKDATAWPSDSVAQLSDALLAEDDARQAYYNSQIPQAKDPAVLIALMRDRVNWLALKYRIARGAFGKNLVDDWSQDPAAIADAWGDAWADLFGVSEQLATAIASPSSMAKPQNPDQAMEDVVRDELITLRWGWYNRVSEPDLIDKLSDVTQKLMNTNLPALHLDTMKRGNKTMFLLVPDDLYGLGDKALPR
ncbi:MAG: hypothetical protein HZB51_16320 [Chloroflexi bacterium]|nr:hypothetical protein [Chloroflexota bacterium]